MAFQMFAYCCVNVFDSRVLCRWQVVYPGRFPGGIAVAAHPYQEKEQDRMIDVTPIRAAIRMLLKPVSVYHRQHRAGVDSENVPWGFIDASATAPPERS
jgi:hypothetical protein